MAPDSWVKTPRHALPEQLESKLCCAMPKLRSTCGEKMDRLKAKVSRQLHRFRHKEPAADNQSTIPDCRRSDVEPVKELSKERSTPYVSSKVSITDRHQHEKPVPRSLTGKRRSLSTSDTQGEVSSVKNDDKPPDSSFTESLKELDGDEGIPRNLWKEAFVKLSSDTQDRLRKRGYKPGSNTNQRELDTLLKDLQEKREFREKEAWKFKNDHLVRDYAATCATWMKLIGDLVVPFAPSQAAGPWGLIKVALEIPVRLAAKMTALLGAVERILQATYRGKLYESAYASENSDIPDTLRRDLVNVYQAVLNLLSNSIDMLSGSTWAMILDAVFDKGSDLFSDLTAKEKELADTAQACSAAQGRKAIQHLQDIQGHLPRIEAQIVQCLKELEEREAREILDWVSTVKYKAHHSNVCNNRTPGTGEWLLQKRTFRDWEEGSSSAVLWLRGSPGVGKTYLTSKVIDHVQDNLARTPNDEGFAYFYCNRTEDIRTRPLAVAQSYVRQLSSSANKNNSRKAYSRYIQSILKSTYEDLSMDCADLDFKCCRELLTEYLNIYPRTTLVLDAFDECDSTSRGDLLQLFTDLLSNSTRPVKLFIASRPDRDVQQQVRSHPNIEVQATDNHQDIQAYISEEMLKLVEKNGAFGELRDTVESTLSKKSQGMFQWTYLQLKQLEKCVSREAILGCLQTLPRTLEDTYEKLLKEIEESHPHDRDLALRALKWVLAAREPLSRGALLDAVRINPDIMTTRLCAPITDDALFALCRNFLTIDSERDVWRVSHLSVAEYFELRCSWTTAVTDFMVGKACLLFMLSDTWSNERIYGPNEDFSDTLAYRYTRSFVSYVASYWPEHIATLRYAGVSDDGLSTVTKLVERFLGAPQDSSAQYRVWARHDPDLQPVEYSVLAVCCFGDCLEVSDRWWNEGELDLANTNEVGQTYMLLAARNGHIPIVQILLGKGGTLGIQGSLEKSTPLIEAARHGRVAMARFLLDQKVDVNLRSEKDNSYTCALEVAVRYEDFDMMQILVLEGHADVNMHLNHDNGSALGHASSQGWLEGTRFLVEQAAADVNLVLQYGDYGSALAAAVGSVGAHLETVKYLVEVGKADVNLPLPRSRYGSVLAAAAWRMRKAVTTSKYHLAANSREIVRFLLAAGASVVLNVGNREIVDALEATYGRLRSRPGCDSTCDDDEDNKELKAVARARLVTLRREMKQVFAGGALDTKEPKYDVQDAEEFARATLDDLQKAMWQQYISGALGIEEAKYVEAKYGQAMKAWRLPNQDS